MVVGTEHTARAGNTLGGPSGQGRSTMDPPVASGPTDVYWHEAQEFTGDDGLNIINLSDYVLSGDEAAILSKDLTLCPSSNMDTFEVIKDLHLFARKLILKSLYAKPIKNSEPSIKER